MMERLVRDPLRAAGHIGNVASLVILVAVLGFGAPPWIFLPVSIGALILLLHVSMRAERRARERQTS
jgi:hypothetical protein